MESLRPRARSPLAGLALVLITGIVAACAGAPTSAPVVTTGPLATAAATEAPTEAAAGTPAPTSLAAVAIAVLPTADVDMSKVKVACDQATLGTGTTMACDDIVKLAARIAATTSANPIKQVAVATSTDNPSGFDVTFWVQAEEGTDLTAFTSTVDPAALTVTVPVENPDATFPA